MKSPINSTTPLNKYLAKFGQVSRRKAEELIKAEKITLNGEVVNRPYQRVKKTDLIKLNGKSLKPPETICLLLNKPKGVTTTCFDRFAKTTVLDLIAKKINLKKGKIYPVGRLDKDSTGLILLTNDGEICYKLTHPKFEVEKEYRLKLSPPFKIKDLPKAKNGVVDKLAKEEKLLKIKTITRAPEWGKEGVKVTLTEGKKRHLRRLFSQLGYRVKKLQRIRVGNLKLGNLKEGDFKIIRPEKIKTALNEKT